MRTSVAEDFVKLTCAIKVILGGRGLVLRDLGAALLSLRASGLSVRGVT